jgi:inosine-uridine nucleoside N-ribohydrolase
MKRLLFFAILHSSFVISQAEPVRLIFDTDMGNDVDDLMALCMIHNLQKRGACELLGVTVTKDHPQAAAFVDAVNTLYGYPDTPIGAEAPEAGGLIKDILAKQPDGSVVIAQVGFFTNLARLMDDAEAKALIAKKVKVLSIMAGAFQTVNFDTRHLEYNVKLDVPAAQKLAKEWPTPMVWSGFEIGVAAAFPHVVIEQDLNYMPQHPLKEAYYLYNPPPHDRPTWDPTAVLYAIYPDRGYFDLSPPGNIKVDDDSATLFRPVKKGEGKHRFLIMSAEQATRVREAIVQLSVEPPPAKK